MRQSSAICLSSTSVTATPSPEPLDKDPSLFTSFHRLSSECLKMTEPEEQKSKPETKSSSRDSAKLRDPENISTPSLVRDLLSAIRLVDIETCRTLINEGADLNGPDEKGITPLFAACEIGIEEIAELFILNGANVNYKKSNGTTALHIASASGRHPIVKLLIDNDADVDAETSGITTPLFVAATGGHASVVNLLCQAGAKIDTKNHRGWTALHAACQSGNPAAIEILLRNGSDVESITSGSASTPLHVAVMNRNLNAVEKLIDVGNSCFEARQADNFTPLMVASNVGCLDILRALLRRGADPNARGSNLRTALHIAAINGHIEIVQELLDCGADKNAKSDTGSTAILMATTAGFPKLVEVLLEHKVSVYEVNPSKSSPVFAAIQRGDVEILELFLGSLGLDLIQRKEPRPLINVAILYGHLSIVKLLIKAGSDPHSRDKERGMTALHEAAHKGKTDILRFLLAAGTQVDILNSAGESPLLLSAKVGHLEIAQCLISQGADVNLARSAGHTALHFAAARGDIQFAKVLLEAGADLEASQYEVGTPLYISAERGAVYMTKYLLKKGAKVYSRCTPQSRTPLHVAAAMGELAVIEALLSAGADIDTENRLSQKPEDVIGSKKPLTVMERGAIEAAFNRYKKSKTYKERSKSLSIPCCPPEIDVPIGTDPHHDDSSLGDPSTSDSVDSKPPAVDNISRRSSTDSFRLFDIKEFISTPSDDLKRRPSTARTPKKTALSWTRLHRQPGSARARSRNSMTESPKRPATLRICEKKARGGSMHIPHLPPSRNHAASISQSQSSPAVLVKASAQSTKDSASSVFKRFPKSKKPSRDLEVKHSRTESQLELVDSKGRPSLFTAARQGDARKVEKLLASGMDPNLHIETHGWTPLYAAARNGHVEVVTKLLESGATVNERINTGATALHGACASGHEIVVRVLIDHGAKLDYTTQTGELPFHTAARNGFLNLVSLQVSFDGSLLDRRRFNDGSTALHLVVEKQWPEAVKQLLEMGADPNIQKHEGITPLYMAAISGDKAIAQILIDSEVPADINSQTEQNWTALHVACARGDLEMVRLLLRNGADPSLTTNMDMTPSDVVCEWVTADGGRTQRIKDILERPPTQISYMLVEAAASGDIKQVKSLLDSGADLNVFGDEGLTPLLYAVRNGHIATVHFLVLKRAKINLSSCPGSISALHYAVLGQSHQLVEFLLSNGADVGNQDESGQTPLHYAAYKGFTLAVNMLLAYKADVHSNDKHGKTPLLMAASSNAHEVVSLLLRNQAYPSCAAADGNTPLHAASEAGGEECVHLLICSRCDPNSRNARKETPLFLACKNGHVNIVIRLLKADVTVNSPDVDGNTALHVACMYGHEEVVEILLRNSEADPNLRNRNGLRCDQMVGQSVAGILDEVCREQILALIESRIDQSDGCCEKKQADACCECFRCPITRLFRELGALKRYLGANPLKFIEPGKRFKTEIGIETSFSENQQQYKDLVLKLFLQKYPESISRQEIAGKLRADPAKVKELIIDPLIDEGKLLKWGPRTAPFERYMPNMKAPEYYKVTGESPPEIPEIDEEAFLRKTESQALRSQEMDLEMLDLKQGSNLDTSHASGQSWEDSHYSENAAEDIWSKDLYSDEEQDESEEDNDSGPVDKNFLEEILSTEGNTLPFNNERPENEKA